MNINQSRNYISLWKPTNLGSPPGIPNPGFSTSLRGPNGLKIIPPVPGAKGSKSDRPTLGSWAEGNSLKYK